MEDQQHILSLVFISLANVAYVDYWVGKILDTLKQEGFENNTLVLFAADHGDMLNDHYLWRKGYPYHGNTITFH